MAARGPSEGCGWIAAILLALAPLCTFAAESSDVAAARALFERNLEAIAKRDRAAYLACYHHADTLARSGPEGFTLGYAALEKDAGDAWPDTFEALDLRLVPVAPGIVYGTYRYRVRYGATEQSGLSERVFLKTRSGWRIAVSTAFEAKQGTPPASRALVGATLLDGTGAPPLDDATLIVQDGRIACVGRRKECPVPAEIATLDVTGRWITPGIVDAHVHFGQTGWADGRPDALDVRDRHPYEQTVADLAAHPERFFRSDLCSGVTAVFDVGGYPWSVEMAHRAAADTRAPHIAAAGPLLTTLDHWLNVPAQRQFIYLSDESAARTGVRYLKSIGSDAVKVWYIITPDRPVEATSPLILAAGDEAKTLGLPLIVHATGLAEAKVALRAGARVLVHSVEDQPVDAEFLDLARANEAIYIPTLTVVEGYRRMYEAALAGKEPELDDPNACVDVTTRARVAETAEVSARGHVDRARLERGARPDDQRGILDRNLKRVIDAGIAVAMGTDAGNPLTLHGPSVHAEMEAMQAAGLTPMQVLVAATANASRAMGREKDWGTLEKGKAADLLILDADPARDVAHMRRVRQVMRGGVLRSIEELRAIVAVTDAKP
jgi:imidazolonepropionase-like amidohydrolase